MKYGMIMAATVQEPLRWMVSDYLSLVSIILVIGGGFFTYRQWAASNKTKRAEWLTQIIEKLRFDEEMVQAMNTIDYDHAWYGADFHDENKKLEYQIDKLLSYLTYICYLKEMKSLSEKEFKLLRYEVNRACGSKQVQYYLWNLYHFSQAEGTECSFQYLIDYGIENRLLDDTFLDSQSSRFLKHKTLEF